MKKIALFSALCLTQIAFSQDFISEDKLWHVKDFSWDIINTQLFKFEGDTNLNSHTYNILWSEWDTSISYYYVEGFFREESNVVYRWDGLNEQILYDFNLETGDTATVYHAFCGEVQVVVAAIDTVEYLGIPRKRWILDGWTDDYWIEGIGSNYGLIYTKLYECVADVNKVLLCFHENDVLSYILDGETECFQSNVGLNEPLNKDSLKVFPNPVKPGQQIVIQCDKEVSEVEVYNVAGVLVEHFSCNQEKTLSISSAQLIPGFYYIRVRHAEGQAFSKKLMIAN